MKPLARLALAAMLACIPLLQGCGARGATEQGLEWDGQPVPVLSRVVGPDTAEMRRLGLSTLAHAPPLRILILERGEWGDSLRILEYSGDLEAYAVFQGAVGHPDELASGLSARGERFWLRLGRWIVVREETMQDEPQRHFGRLSLPGAVPGRLPGAFASLLHRGRIPGSERVQTGAFLGIPVTVAVLSARADCRGDTAWVYAAPGLRRAFATEVARLSGWRADTLDAGIWMTSGTPEMPPFSLLVTRSGTVGVEGCFDNDLTRKWIFMQSRALKRLK
jgi:hypothetical protein